MFGAQMSMFFPKERRMGKLVPLYMGSKDGFSMGMFKSKVLKYPGTQTLWDVRSRKGPMIILVKDMLMNARTSASQRAHEIRLPP